jgi:guanylate kinase/non-canonical purine NTP pyrophosphatase (RdgB/HAM1 family)
VRRIVLASGNAGKLRELGALLAPLGLELLSQDALGIPAVPETGATFLDNALLKARHAAGRSGLPALADDSGLEVDALGGRPGVHSARYAGEGASDAANLAQLLAELEGVPAARRGARYQCVMVLVRTADDPAPLVGRGSWEGRIALEPRGSGGFGYDPVFVPAGDTRTAAELAPGEKNAVSHRGMATRALLAALGEGGIKSAPMTRGRLIVISAPSGAGKTSLVKALRTSEPRLRLSISHTTRTRRPTEAEGREYHFVSREQFEQLAARGEFLEHARVFDNYYGTSRAFVERELAQGHDVLLEIDWQGAQQVRRALPQCLSIFVLPPSRASLAERLARRATDTPEVIERRLRDAAGDMSHYGEFDYVVVNDDFERAVADIRRVIAGSGEDLRSHRPELVPLVAQLLGAP